MEQLPTFCQSGGYSRDGAGDCNKLSWCEIVSVTRLEPQWSSTNGQTYRPYTNLYVPKQELYVEILSTDGMSMVEMIVIAVIVGPYHRTGLVCRTLTAKNQLHFDLLHEVHKRL